MTGRGNFIIYNSAILAFAVVYALVFGIHSGMSAELMVADSIVYSVVLWLVSVLTRNVFKYAVPEKSGYLFRVFLTVVMCVITVGCVIGVESLIMYGLMGGMFGLFTSALALRIFVTALAFIILLLYSRGGKTAEKEFPAEAGAALGTGQDDAIEHITVRTGQKIRVINCSEVDYLQAEGDYVAIVTCEGRWLKEQTMKYFEESLPADKFVRIHRSYIVNVTRISGIERYGNLHNAILHSGDKVNVSAGGYRLLKQRFDL